MRKLLIFILFISSLSVFSKEPLVKNKTQVNDTLTVLDTKKINTESHKNLTINVVSREKKEDNQLIPILSNLLGIVITILGTLWVSNKMFNRTVSIENKKSNEDEIKRNKRLLFFLKIQLQNTVKIAKVQYQEIEKTLENLKDNNGFGFRIVIREELNSRDYWGIKRESLYEAFINYSDIENSITDYTYIQFGIDYFDHFTVITTKNDDKNISYTKQAAEKLNKLQDNIQNLINSFISKPNNNQFEKKIIDAYKLGLKKNNLLESSSIQSFHDNIVEPISNILREIPSNSFESNNLLEILKIINELHGLKSANDLRVKGWERQLIQTKKSFEVNIKTFEEISNKLPLTQVCYVKQLRKG
jgi:hypothetical protein